jgi:hypothetical protein
MIGTKIKIPVTKHGESNYHSVVVNRAKNKLQDFLYITEYIEEDNLITLNDVLELNLGDYFNINELVQHWDVGSMVKIKTNLIPGNIYGLNSFVDSMDGYMGKKAQIIGIGECGYRLNIDDGEWWWTSEMFESEIRILKYKCIKSFPGVNVGDVVDSTNHSLEYFDPEYFSFMTEETPVNIQNYTSNFNSDGTVSWGCKKFNKEQIKQVIDFVEQFNRMDLDIGIRHTNNEFDKINAHDLRNIYTKMR